MSIIDDYTKDIKFELEHRDLINTGMFRIMNQGVQIRWQFKNGFGASLIQSKHSYGGEAGFWELAVLNSEGRITYKTSITKDVIGFLPFMEAMRLVVKISNLKKTKVQK